LDAGVTTEISGRVCFLFSLKAMKPRGRVKTLACATAIHRDSPGR
jgi:hypothetical protein